MARAKDPKGKGGGWQASKETTIFIGAATGNGKYILSFRIFFLSSFFLIFFPLILVVFHFHLHLQGRRWQEIRERTFR